MSSICSRCGDYEAGCENPQSICRISPPVSYGIPLTSSFISVSVDVHSRVSHVAWHFLTHGFAGRREQAVGCPSSALRLGPFEKGLDGVEEFVRGAEIAMFLPDLATGPPKISLRSMPSPRRNDGSAAEPPSTRTTCELRSRTDEFPAPRRSVRVRPTHERLAPCGN